MQIREDHPLTHACVVVTGCDTSVGLCPMVNSVLALIVAFMMVISKEPSSLMSSKLPEIMTLAFLDRMVSQPTSID